MISISFLLLTRLSTLAPMESTCMNHYVFEGHAFTYSSQPYYLNIIIIFFSKVANLRSGAIFDHLPEFLHTDRYLL